MSLAIAEARSEITIDDEVPIIHAENGDGSETIRSRFLMCGIRK